jgi:hypothetical protein
VTSSIASPRSGRGHFKLWREVPHGFDRYKPHVSRGRYPVLRTIAILWLVGAVLAICYGVYQAVCALANLPSLEAVGIGASWASRIIGCLIWLAVTFFAVLVNVGIAELIKLAIDVEQNTRMTAMNTSAIPNAPCAPAMVASDGGGRFASESAESALIRGH